MADMTTKKGEAEGLQQALGLDPLDINIILHIASYWWSESGKPHPSKLR
jgi:hypothetical protein